MKECPKCHYKTLYFGEHHNTQKNWNCASCGLYYNHGDLPHSILKQLGKPYESLYLNKPDRTVEQ